MDNDGSLVLQQLVGYAPRLLACAAGIFVAIRYWRRCASASLLVVIAASLLTLLAFEGSLATVYFARHRAWSDWSADTLRSAMGVHALVTSVFHAIGLGLLIAAAFVGRVSRGAPAS